MLSKRSVEASVDRYSMGDQQHSTAGAAIEQAYSQDVCVHRISSRSGCDSPAGQDMETSEETVTYSELDKRL